MLHKSSVRERSIWRCHFCNSGACTQSSKRLCRSCQLLCPDFRASEWHVPCAGARNASPRPSYLSPRSFVCGNLVRFFVLHWIGCLCSCGDYWSVRTRLMLHFLHPGRLSNYLVCRRLAIGWAAVNIYSHLHKRAPIQYRGINVALN